MMKQLANTELLILDDFGIHKLNVSGSAGQGIHLNPDNQKPALKRRQPMVVRP